MVGEWEGAESNGGFGSLRTAVAIPNHGLKEFGTLFSPPPILYRKENRMRQMLSIVAALSLSLVLVLPLTLAAGCAIRHPNQRNAFDGATYDTLIVAQAALNQAKVEVAAFPQYKEQVNQAIAAYNAARAAYALYHTAAAGAPTQDELQAQISDLVSRIASLEKAFGVKLQ
jgi:hypothetical protein